MIVLIMVVLQGGRRRRRVGTLARHALGQSGASAVRVGRSHGVPVEVVIGLRRCGGLLLGRVPTGTTGRLRMWGAICV